ncbi:MAG: ABC transporter ATP-binding protein [Pirellulales bacterium]|nr:ABC transporter ATP-binding protein [Pirellulales bacterium]
MVDRLPTAAPPRIDTTTVAVACRGLTKEFDSGESKVRAVSEVDVDVYAGELTLLVGPSGCGKTTLISLVAGLLEPTNGAISLFGVDQSELSNRQRLRYRAANIGFVFQQYNLLPALSATDNVAVPLLIGHRDRNQARQIAAGMLDQVELTDRAHARPNQLSGGQQQRVAIARALVHEPRLLVCDEPTAALDAHSGQTIMELLRRVAVQSDRAVIVVTHDSRVFSYGDRIIEMADGRVVRVEAKSAAAAKV